MHVRAFALVLLALALGALSACGSDQNRPVVVATFPPQGAELLGTIDQVRIRFDDPVSLLNPLQYSVTTGGVAIPLVSIEDPDDPYSILLVPPAGQFWRVGSTSLVLRAGWEVNDEGHYRLDDYTLVFSLGEALPVYFGVPAPPAVVETAGPDFVPVGTIPTPGARVPVGLECSTVEAEQQTWVQLADGGGAGEALAWFARGAAAMSAIPLTHEVGGDLVSGREAIAVDEAGEFVYAAWRDTALGRVRLCKLAVSAAAEVATLVLSPPASPATSPQGLAVSLDGQTVNVACSTDAGARLVAVDLETFTELDLGPDAGVDALPLPSGAGPVGIGNTLSMIAPFSATEALLTTANLETPAVEDLPSFISGSPTSLLLTPDLRFLVVGLSGYVDDEAVSYRSLANLNVEEPVVIDDVTGAGNGPATALLDVAWFTGSTRLIALLDNDAAIYLRFLPGGVDQEDLDESTPGAAVDLSAIAPGATLVAIPPPAVLTPP